MSKVNIDFKQFDDEVVAAIASGKKKYHELVYLTIRRGVPDYRKLDRRLQSLRKRGIIKYDSKLGWSIQGQK